MMDPMDIDIRIKRGPNGLKICYSKDCPEIVGIAAEDDQAVTEFWKSFNRLSRQREARRLSTEKAA